MVGALAGRHRHRHHRPPQAVLLTVVAFSVLTLLCAFAPNPWVFGLLRFLAGLGLGGVLPVAIALVNEYARTGRGGQATTTLMTGYHVGAVVTALLGICSSRRSAGASMFVFGALPALVLVPLMLRYLPESESFLGQGRARRAAGRRAPRARNPMAILFQHGLPVHHRVLGHLVHGPAARLRAEHVAAADHARRRLRPRGRARPAAGAERRRRARAAGGRPGGRPHRHPQLHHRLVHRGRAVPGAASIRLPGIGVYVSVLLAGMFVFSAQVLVYAYVSQSTRPPPAARPRRGQRHRSVRRDHRAR